MCLCTKTKKKPQNVKKKVCVGTEAEIFGTRTAQPKRKYIENIRGLERSKSEAEIPLKN